VLWVTQKNWFLNVFFNGVISTGEFVTFSFLVSVHDQIHDLSLASSSLDDSKGRFLVVGVTHIESTDIEAFVGVVFKTSNWLTDGSVDVEVDATGLSGKTDGTVFGLSFNL